MPPSKQSFSKQFSFFEKPKPQKQGSKKLGRNRKRPGNVFGGMYFKNYNPSMQRPIRAKKALHLVMRSCQAKGGLSFKNKKFEAKIWDIIKKHAFRNGITIYSYANAGNHLHLLIRVRRRDAYHRFIRSVTGLIARVVGGSEKGRKLKKKFWDARPFTRIVSFSKYDFPYVKAYLLKNTLETIGWIPYIKRSQKMPPQWKMFWQWAMGNF